MSFFRDVWNTMTQLRDYVRLKQSRNISQSLIISRDISENITIGIGKNGSQIMKYKNSDGINLYKFNYIKELNNSNESKKSKSLIYYWNSENSDGKRAILEFFTIPPNSVHYKLYTLTDKPEDTIGIFTIPERGIFNHHLFKPIGIIGSEDIDKLAEFCSCFS